jgi:phthiocerol/phenolphthiocerol synthesis type-I polyketide synthase E
MMNDKTIKNDEKKDHEPLDDIQLKMTAFDAKSRGESPEKSDIRELYNAVTSQLNATEISEFMIFLNFGYFSDGSLDLAAVELPKRYLNKNCVQLVLELIGDCPVRSTDSVLDVGCGRGGTLSVFKQFFKVSKRTGLDLSPLAVAFCRQQHGDENTVFVEGDAESLPFEDNSMDIVTNVESSHCYPNIERFFEGVRRVLKPGGYFLYTDALRADLIGPNEAKLRELGFEFIHHRDITKNILLSLDETSKTHSAAFEFDNNNGALDCFLAMPGTVWYEDMKNGTQRYVMYQLRLNDEANL